MRLLTQRRNKQGLNARCEIPFGISNNNMIRLRKATKSARINRRGPFTLALLERESKRKRLEDRQTINNAEWSLLLLYRC